MSVSAPFVFCSSRYWIPGFENCASLNRPREEELARKATPTGVKFGSMISKIRLETASGRIVLVETVYASHVIATPAQRKAKSRVAADRGVEGSESVDTAQLG